MQPFFSIVIPVYNVEPYIARCLDSCINQTFRDIEIIIIDDCGSDNSIKIAEEYAKKDSRITIIHNPRNLGLFHTRIAGEKHSQGKYILPLDSDDFINISTCEILFQKLNEDYQLSGQWSDIIHFGMDFYPKNYKNLHHKIHYRSLYDKEIMQDIFLKNNNPTWSIWSKAYSKKTLYCVHNFIDEQLNISNIVMAEDVLKLFLVTYFSKKSVGIKNNMYIYCYSQTSITRKQDKKSRYKKIQDIKKVIQAFDQIHIIIPKDNLAQTIILRIQKYLYSIIALELRYESKTFSYFKACMKSISYYPKPTTFIRLTIYLLSFGKIKL